MKTHGDRIREVEKQSLWNEICNLENKVRVLRNNDFDCTEDDAQVIAYRKVIAKKKQEYEMI